jgi:hypothetical protein
VGRSSSSRGQAPRCSVWPCPRRPRPFSRGILGPGPSGRGPADATAIQRHVTEWELELAWSGGFFEGEGTITLNHERASVQIKNTDLEPLRRFQRSVETGTIYGPYWYGRRYPMKKRFWLWVALRDDAHRVIRLLGPALSARRLAQALDVLPQVRGTTARAADDTYAWVRELVRERTANGSWLQ